MTGGGKGVGGLYKYWCGGQYPTVGVNNLILSVLDRGWRSRTAISSFLLLEVIPCNKNSYTEEWTRIALYLILFHLNMRKMARWYARKCLYTRFPGSVVWFVVDSSRDVWHDPKHAGGVSDSAKAFYSSRPECRPSGVRLFIFSSLILIFHQYSVSKIDFYHAILQDSIHRHQGLEL